MTEQQIQDISSHYKALRNMGAMSDLECFNRIMLLHPDHGICDYNNRALVYIDFMLAIQGTSVKIPNVRVYRHRYDRDDGGMRGMFEARQHFTAVFVFEAPANEVLRAVRQAERTSTFQEELFNTEDLYPLEKNWRVCALKFSR